MVDPQVRAIWAALQHEFRLAYINPPPSYTGQAQRLRSPSQILAGGAATCIDLALLFCACLEYIGVYPAIFLIQGHAFPGATTRVGSLQEVIKETDEVIAADMMPAFASFFVAAPIAGTSLASAPRVRDFLDFLMNLGDQLSNVTELASLAAPWLTAALGFMRLGTALNGGLANLLIADGLIALVPGLQGQARIGNNEEIRRLQRGVARWYSPEAKLRYFAITADFQPIDPGWNFLEYFSQSPGPRP